MSDAADEAVLIHEVLTAQLQNTERVLRSVVPNLEALPHLERTKLKAAMADGAELLALAAAGDSEAAGELAVVRATVMLWTWTGAERERKAWVAALRQWLREACSHLADVGVAVLELGLRVIVDAGLSQLED